MFNLKAYLAGKKETINASLDERMHRIVTDSRIVEAMRYSLNAGGKRIRPILSIAAAESVGGKESDVLNTACAIEMIHTYSLIHDDLPAMDNDDLRRGQPTSHVKFDEATAILAGDALLTLAFETLSSAPSLKDTRPAVSLSIIHILASAAGCRGMIDGQLLDVISENKEITLSELETIHRLKTGALIEASIHAGALLGNGDTAEIAMLRTYGKHIGLAFQVMDDILNVKGDPSLMGKAVGSDAQRGKITYPAVMGMKRSEAYASQLVHSGLQAIQGFDTKADPLRAIASYIFERKS
jgi:geranylgeranyl diphosphate synthase type II